MLVLLTAEAGETISMLPSYHNTAGALLPAQKRARDSTPPTGLIILTVACCCLLLFEVSLCLCKGEVSCCLCMTSVLLLTPVGDAPTTHSTRFKPPARPSAFHLHSYGTSLAALLGTR